VSDRKEDEEGKTMVVQGDFTVSLVHADSKEPFQEHAKDGEVYAEVEPDAEYFISVQKTGAALVAKSPFLLKFFVDGQDLCYYRTWNATGKDEKPLLSGLFSRTNGVTSMKALKFEKPRPSSFAPAAGRGPTLLMGKVEIKVYEGVFLGNFDAEDSAAKALTVAPVDLSQNKAAKKKGLRTGEGSTILREEPAAATSANKSLKQAKYQSGSLLDTITLNYCAAQGLIEVGVLSKPSAGGSKPGSAGAENRGENKNKAAVKKEGTKSSPAKKIRDPTTGKEVEVLELLDSDDEE
jgi:hypothetical protein